ncbi:IniB N-terminal domain-containing protein [Gordonia sp. CPCC 205333]|uniref:IniB N-terminal domain-containing protein n=1 Tax=Gordonia sp. CPCC 205333 TaxID=3140790 RepID=UPI003AF3AF4D
MSVNQSIVDFIMELLGNSDKAQQFADNPGKCMADSGLHDVTPTEVAEAIPTVVEQVSYGGGEWCPPMPPGGSPADIITQVINNYYTTVIGDNNTVVQANGPGSVAVGGDNDGNISTGGGVTGDGNDVGNTSTSQTKNVDNSVHGNNSGNAASTANTDSSTTDNHAATNVTGGDGGTKQPIEPQGLHPMAATMPSSAVTSPAATGISPIAATTPPLSATTSLSASTPLDSAMLTTVVAADDPTGPGITPQLFGADTSGIPLLSEDNSTPVDPSAASPEPESDVTIPDGSGSPVPSYDFADDGYHSGGLDPAAHEAADIATAIPDTPTDLPMPVADTYSPDTGTDASAPQGIVAPEAGHDIPDGVYY